jgi:hypothetical protein
VSKDADRQGPVFVAPSELAARESLREQSEFLAELSRLISSEVRRLPGVEVAQVTTNMTADGARKAIAVLRTPTPISPVQTASIERALNAVMKPPVSLVVRSLVTVDTSPAGYLYQPILEEDVLTGLELDLHERLTSEAKKVLPSIVVGSALLEVRFAYLDPSILVFASVETPTVFTPSQVRKLETSLRSKVNPKIQVVVRSVTGIVSSSRSYEHSFSEEAYDLRPRRPIAK